MNNKGQSLVIFIIIIPVIFIVFSFLYDYAYIINSQNKYENVTRTILNSTLEEDKIVDLYRQNGYKVDDFKYKKENDKVYIQNSYKIKSVFGNIVNLKNYTVSINYVVINSNNGIIIEDISLGPPCQGRGKRYFLLNHHCHCQHYAV